MKKFVAGILVGLMLFAGTSVLAKSISKLVGTKVQGVYTLEKNGIALGEAAILDGTAYAPLRIVSKAAGVELTIEGKTIRMSENTNETGDYVLSPEALELANDQAKLRGTVSSSKIMLVAAQSTLKMYQDALATDAARETPMPGYAEAVKTNIEKTQDEITKLQAEITLAETRIKELQTQIDAMKP